MDSEENIRELINHQYDIMSTQDDKEFQLYDLKQIDNKIPHYPINDLYKAYANNTLIKDKKGTSSIEEFQLNLYKQNKTTINTEFIELFKCYVNNKFKYIELYIKKKANVKIIKQICNLLNKNNVNYYQYNNSFFIDQVYQLYIYKLLKLFINNKTNIRFIDSNFQILTTAIYKKVNNAIIINFYKDDKKEKQIIIYQWNNFNQIIDQLNTISFEFNFHIDVILNHAVNWHYCQ